MMCVCIHGGKTRSLSLAKGCQTSDAIAWDLMPLHGSVHIRTIQNLLHCVNRELGPIRYTSLLFFPNLMGPISYRAR